MRGKVEEGLGDTLGERITPAYAGKSCYLIGCLFRLWDHPRLCGEKKDTRGRRWRQSGSPPPMRGKACPPSTTICIVRITPAYAGKSCGLCTLSRPSRDHPRLCGEKSAEELDPIYDEGSPPPMRGKGTNCFFQCKSTRITPAYAGKRHRPAIPLPVRWDHPRLCGEKSS